MSTTKTILRWFVAFVLAIAITPAFAAPEKKYTLDVSPAIVLSPVEKMTVVVNNVSTGGNSNISSLKVYLPEGYTLKVDAANPVTHTWTNVVFSAPNNGTVIGFSSMSPLRPTNSFQLKFSVNVPACGVQSSWATPESTPTAWNGTGFNGSDIFKLISEPLVAVNTKTTVGGSPSIAFDATNPTSALKGADVTLKVKLLNGCGAPANGTVTLGSIPLAFTGSGDQATVDGVASFTGKFSALGKTTLSAYASGFGTTTAPLTVFDGILECATAPFNALNLPAPTTAYGEFSNSTGGATEPGDIGFLAGIRGSGDPLKDPCLVDINYSATNNINGLGDVPDPLNNYVPPGFYSFTWDVSQVEKPVVAIIATMKSQWGDATTGLPTRQTLICTVSECQAPPYTDAAKTVVNSPTWKPAVACLGTLVTHASIPDGELGCLVSESWEVVPEFIGVNANPDYCAAATKPTKPAGWPANIVWAARCHKPTAIMIVGQDPIVGRGQ